MADNSGDVILHSDWLPRVEGARFWLAAESRGCSILIGYRVKSVQCIMIWNRKPSQCIMLGNSCIKIGSACIKTGSQKPSQRIKIGNACINIGMHVLRYAIPFGKVIAWAICSSQSIKIRNASFSTMWEYFEKNIFWTDFFLQARPAARLLLTPVDKFYLRMLCEKILW